MGGGTLNQRSRPALRTGIDNVPISTANPVTWVTVAREVPG